MNFRKNKNKQAGMGLVEIVIGAAIITAGLLALSTSYTLYLQYALANQHNVEASYLLEEGVEAVTFFRDMSWSGNILPLSTTTTYYLTWNGTRWATTTTAQYVDGLFLRSLSVSDVNRDGSDDISSSGTYDPNTKKITVSVDYFQGHATSTKSISAYIANLYTN